MSDRTLAGRGRRLAATVIDLLLVVITGFALLLVTGALEDAEDYASSYFYLRIPALGVAAWLLLNGAPLWRRGQSIGKLILGIRIVRLDGDLPGPLVHLGRAFFFLLLYASATPLGVLALIDHVLILRADRRCLHDLLLRTEVVRTDAGEQASAEGG